MRLMTNEDGALIKYALIDNRTGETLQPGPGDQEEFFVIKLKDRFSAVALRSYAEAVLGTDLEYANEIMALADRAGPNSPYCKTPD